MSTPRPRAPLLIPNVAAEEGAVWNAPGGEPQVRAVTRLWRMLFGSDARLLGDDGETEELWPEALGPVPLGPAFPHLEEGKAYAWLHTAEAQALAAGHGYELAEPRPEAVRRVHDKAFARRWAQENLEEPVVLRGLTSAFEPEPLRDTPDAVLREVESAVSAWPGWTEGRFTLKPRFGSSGRGRVGGGRRDVSAIRGALPRLAERGGAVLEPWLERVRDLSAQLVVEPGGGVRLLGTVELLVSPAGVYQGHRGSVDNKGRVTSLCPEDEHLREAAAQLAAEAGAEGFVGPCGVDAFLFRGPGGEHVFRPVVEFNARFTMGTIALGLLRRALPTLRRALPRDASERRAFHFSLTPPPAGWPRNPSEHWWMLPLGPASEPDAAAGLLVALDRGHLEMAFQAADTPPMLSPH